MKNISNITKIETSLDLEGMSLAEAKSAVDNMEKIFQKYNAESAGIIIANSDPLDHPDLDAVIDYIASKNISVSLLTRGAKLTEDRIAAWSGKVTGIGIYKNLIVLCEDSDFDGFYPEEETEVPEQYANLAKAASKANINFKVSDEILARIEDEKKENEQNMFYEIKALNRGLVERSAKGSIATWEDNTIKEELFPYENSEGYEIVTKMCDCGGLVTVRRTVEISSEEAKSLIEIGEYDRLVTIEAKSEDEAKKIFCEKHLCGNSIEKYELSIEAKTLDEMIEREVDDINDMFERLGGEVLGNKCETLSRKRIRYEGMKAVLSAYKMYGFLEHHLDASKMPANEFNRLLERIVKVGGKPENARGWKAVCKKYGVKNSEV
jgi:hypothetical protein